MVVMDNIVKAYRSRDAFRDENGKPNWAEWTTLHPDLADLLTEAEIIANDG